MAAPSNNKCKADHFPQNEAKRLKTHNNVEIYILQRKLQKRRIELLKKAAKRCCFSVSESFRDSVTHVVCEDSTLVEEAMSSLGMPAERIADVELLTMAWLTDSLKDGSLLPLTDAYRLKNKTQVEPDEVQNPEVDRIPEYICMRSNPLKHFNEKYTDALELLEKNARLHDDDTRALAFRRCAATLRGLPYPVTQLGQVQGLPDVGNHCLRVIKDIIENGSSTEAEDIENSSEFQKLKAFNGVFGIGPSTARKWISKGISTVNEACCREDIHKSDDSRVSVGLAFHEDLALPVSLSEASQLTAVISAEACRLLPGVIVEMTGGFRRAKPEGHDLDILISHPQEGKEQGILGKLLRCLGGRGLIVYGKQEKSTYSEEVLKSDKGQALRSSLDHFEKWLGVMKVDKQWRDEPTAAGDNSSDTSRQCSDEAECKTDGVMSGVKEKTNSVVGDPCRSLDSLEERIPLRHQNSFCSYHQMAVGARTWRARRVDLIVVPYSQWAYALVGWTGSRQFNRSLRLYAQRKFNMKLTSHGIYDYNTGKSVPAQNEQDVFDILQIPYQKPEDRNA